MNSYIRVAAQQEAGYREEPARNAIIIVLVVLMLAGVAMGLYFRQLAHHNHSQTAMASSLVEKTAGVGKTVEDLQNELVRGRQEVMPQPVPIPDPTPIGTSDLPGSAELNRLPGTINGIIWSESNPVVIIDRESYEVSDKVNYTIGGKAIGFTIVKISEEKVVFKNIFGVEFEESLYSESDRLKTE